MGGKRTKISDNLFQETYPNGTTYFLFRATIDGKRVSKSLGKKGEIGVREARARANELLVSLRSSKEEPPSPLFKNIYAKAIDDIAEIRQWFRSDAKRSWLSTIEAYAVPVIGDIEVEKVTRNDILLVLSPIWKDKNPTAVVVLQRLEAIFNWCIVRSFRQSQNPATWRGNIDLFLPSPSKVAATEHRAAPTVEELKSIVASLLDEDSPAAGVILLIIASACRAGEARGARAEEFIGDVWTIPAERMKIKSAGAHRVPITPLVRAAIEKATGRDGFLFASKTGQGTIAGSFVRRTLHKVFSGRYITLHGIRSTFRDWAAENGVPDAVAEKCLAHKWGSAVTVAYYRSDLLEQRRDAMERWSDLLMGKKIPHT